jgi:hypothetical protein
MIMATCKVLSKPDYELTLSSEEKDALQNYLNHSGRDTTEKELLYGIWLAIEGR